MKGPDEKAVDFETTRWIWGTDISERRLVYILLRVQDLDRSIKFYREGLEMKVFDRANIGPARSTVAIVGFTDYATGGLIELSCPWDNEKPFTHGTGYDHFSVGVGDIHGAVQQAVDAGAEIDVPPTGYLGRGPLIAFLKDPDGYRFEFIQTVRE